MLREMIEFYRNRTQLEANFYADQIRNLRNLLNTFRIEQRDITDRAKLGSLHDKLRFENDETNRFYIERAIREATQSFEDRKTGEYINSQIEAYKEAARLSKENHTAQVNQLKTLTTQHTTILTEGNKIINDLNHLFKSGFDDILRQMGTLNNNFATQGSNLGRIFAKAFLKEAAAINDFKTLGTITQNFYNQEMSPWQARLFAQDIMTHMR